MKSDTPTSCRCRSVRQCLHAPHDKWRGHQTGVMSRPGPVEMRTRSDIPVLLTAPAIDLRASLSDNARDGRAPNSRQTQTGKYVGVPVIFAGIRQRRQELPRHFRSNMGSARACAGTGAVEDVAAARKKLNVSRIEGHRLRENVYGDSNRGHMGPASLFRGMQCKGLGRCRSTAARLKSNHRPRGRLRQPNHPILSPSPASQFVPLRTTLS